MRVKIAAMPAWICATCAVQQPDTPEPPATCAICLDERQYVGHDGQRWTTMAEIARAPRGDLREEEPDLVGIAVRPSFAIGQRALLVRTEHGNVMWDGIPLLDDNARAEIENARRHQRDLPVAPALLCRPYRIRRRI